MATISPVFDFVSAQAAKVPRVTWADIATGDTVTALPIDAQAAVAGAVQFGGTFGGATATLQVSNDGVTWFTARDITGVGISTVAAALFEFTSAAMYIRPAVTGGAANAVDVTLMLRG